MKKLFVIVLLSLWGGALFAQTEQIEHLQKQQEELRQEIKNVNKLFLDVKKQTTTLLQRISLINKQITARKDLIGVQRSEISALEREQARLEKEIEKLNADLKKKQESYAKAIRGMMRNTRSNNKLFFVLSGKSLGESLRRMQYLKKYSEWRKTQAEEIKVRNKTLEEKKSALAQAKADRQHKLVELQETQQKLLGEEQARQSEVSEARGKQQELQKTLQDKRQQAQRLNSQIEKLIAEEVARQEREAEAQRRAEAERKRREEERLAKEKKKETTTPRKTEEREVPKPPVKEPPKKEVYVASAETFNLSRDFSANKGRLPMPVTGTASVVSRFGVSKSSEWNVSTNSNGIDIQARKGANIRSVFDGEVSKVFSFPGSNTCVIIRHGNYYTFYANIANLFVKQGDKVKTGQALGTIFTDPDTGISNMHFQLWQKTTKLDPAPWLKK